MSLPFARWDLRFLAFSRLGALVVVGIGVEVIIGWIFDVSFLKTGLPGLITMKANTAIAFLAAGLSLWLGRMRRTGEPRTGILGTQGSLILGCMVLAMGIATAFEHITDIGLGIDELFFFDDPSLPGVKLRGRMSPISALNFCLVGAGLIYMSLDRGRMQWWALWCATPVLLVAVQALIGYAFGVESLYLVKPFSALAIHTALGFALLAACMLAAVPNQGFMQIIASETAGGLVARRLLPLILVSLFGIGWASRTGEEVGFFNVQFGDALMVLLSMAFCAGIVLWHAGVLYRVDNLRSLAVAESVALNESLERKVEERTRELQQALDEVKKLGGMLPICAWCKKIRDDMDYWHSVETFISERTAVKFTHGMCPDCFDKQMIEDHLVSG